MLALWMRGARLHRCSSQHALFRLFIIAPKKKARVQFFAFQPRLKRPRPASKANLLNCCRIRSVRAAAAQLSSPIDKQRAVFPSLDTFSNSTLFPNRKFRAKHIVNQKFRCIYRSKLQLTKFNQNKKFSEKNLEKNTNFLVAIGNSARVRFNSFVQTNRGDKLHAFNLLLLLFVKEKGQKSPQTKKTMPNILPLLILHPLLWHCTAYITIIAIRMAYLLCAHLVAYFPPTT